MRRIMLAALALASSSLGSIGCRSEGPTASDKADLSSFANSAWSAPTTFGAPVNSAASDQNAILSKDGLSLYLSSARTDLLGAQGNLDIWVSQRSTTADAWGTPRNLGTIINTTATELAPNLSADGHLLFFTSNRAGSTPLDPPASGLSVDIWMSSRTDTEDDFSWGTPVKLGPGVNTASSDQAPMYLQNAEEGSGNLYFNRGVLQQGRGNIYFASVTRHGEILGDAVAVTELNLLHADESPANEAAVSIRADGREIIFWSDRDGTQDLFASTRRSIHHPWSAPTKLESPLSTDDGDPLTPTDNDLTPSLSFDGRTLIFSSNRTPTRGGNDLYFSTRTPSGK
jgi:hypothetical protein